MEYYSPLLPRARVRRRITSLPPDRCTTPQSYHWQHLRLVIHVCLNCLTFIDGLDSVSAADGGMLGPIHPRIRGESPLDRRLQGYLHLTLVCQ